MDRYSEKVLKLFMKAPSYEITYQTSAPDGHDYQKFVNAVNYLVSCGYLRYSYFSPARTPIGATITHEGMFRKEIARKQFWHDFFTRYLTGFISGILSTVLSGVLLAYILLVLGI